MKWFRSPPAAIASWASRKAFVPVTAASASQAMAARDRNAKMPELKQPLLLSGALAATGSVAGRGLV